jgi:hypothetical protein
MTGQEQRQQNWSIGRADPGDLTHIADSIGVKIRLYTT